MGVAVAAAAVFVVNDLALSVIAEQSDDAVATAAVRKSLEQMMHSFGLYSYVVAVIASRLAVAAVASLGEADHAHEWDNLAAMLSLLE